MVNDVAWGNGDLGRIIPVQDVGRVFKETARGIVRGNAMMIQWKIGLAGILLGFVRSIGISYGEKDIERIAREFGMVILAEDQSSQFSSSHRGRAR